MKICVDFYSKAQILNKIDSPMMDERYMTLFKYLLSLDAAMANESHSEWVRRKGREFAKWMLGKGKEGVKWAIDNPQAAAGMAAALLA